MAGAVVSIRANPGEELETVSTIALSGAGGLVGSRLLAVARAAGERVIPLVRRPARTEDEIEWRPDSGLARPARLEDMDAVVHLAGESIAAGRWTKARMARIRDSRVAATRRLAQGMAGLDRPPRTFVCASAVGFYGDRGADVLGEDAAAGTGFLPEVCAAWEAATEPAAAAGVRVVNLRIGVVLSPEGGALPRMLLPFRIGLGGRIGSGRQFWSWITLDDLVRALRHALAHGALHGPVNAVTPHPVTNFEFTKILGRVLGRPTLAPLPAPVARLVLGKMADDLLLASARVAPRQLESSGFTWQQPQLEGALRALLGRPARG